MSGVLIAGVGNILLGDDGFGVAVANRLAGCRLPEGVRVADFGIRGVHLAYELLDGYDTLILVDAAGVDGPPGTVSVIDAGAGPASVGTDADPVLDGHRMTPDLVLGTLSHLGGSVGRVYVVGCAPGCLDEGIGLSAAVAGAVGPAAEECLNLAAEAVRPREEGPLT